jgi:TolB protein
MKLIILLFMITLSLGTWGQSNLTVVAVGEAEVEKDLIGFVTPKLDALNAQQATQMKELIEILKSDFDFYRNLFIVEDKTIKKVSESKAKFVAEFEILKESDGFYLESVLKNIPGKVEVIKDKRKILFQDIRPFSHALADTFYRSLTGKKSIFESKIVFVSDRTSTKGKVRKELYIMDFDGKRKQKLTSLNSMIISPALSQDNKKILYSLIEDRKKKNSSGVGYQNIKNLNLHLLDLETKKTKVISNELGINSGAIFNKNGESIYLTLSRQKNADIYKMNLKTGAKRKITNHFAEDVDPHINSDESLMTFLSGRPGKAMIYTLDPSSVEKNVKRISFVGRFNAAPRFNPKGTEIVFSSWVDDRFDIYRINSDGRNLVRLTKNFGSNEEPWYSPDGEFIVFTSQRVISRKKATQDVYIMNREGEIIRKITEGYGKIYTPRWSN